MKLGTTVPGHHPLDSSRMLMGLAQALGCDSLWLPDHLQGALHPGLWSEMAYSALAADFDAFLDPWIVLGILGQEWAGPIGMSVTDATRRKAADVARATLTLHHLSQGGFHLGIGSGEAMNLTPYGYEFSTPVGTLESFLIELRALLTSGKMPDGLPGRMGLPLQRDDLGPPKVWIAGHGPRMLRLTGQHADGWLPAWPMSPAQYAEKRRIIAGHAAEAQRPEPEAGLLIFALLGQSRDYIVDLMEKDPLGKLWALNCPADRWAAHGVEHPFGPDCTGYVDVVMHDHDPDVVRELAPGIPFEVLEEVIFMGNAAEILERVAAYTDAGLEHLVFVNFTGMVGGMAEIMANTEQLFTLAADLKAL